MPVLILKNNASEGPGTIAEHLDACAIPYGILEPEAISAGGVSLDGYDTLVVLGGPQGVYERDAHPHVAEGIRLITQAIGRGMRVLGVCLGAQMLAHALGGRVYKGHVEEVGWMPVCCTTDGRTDNIFGALVEGFNSSEFNVFQWHGDTFDLPESALRLASSSEYPNQAFSFDGRAYALQFHVEVTRKIIAEWFKDKLDRDAILETTDRLYPGLRARAGRFYERFFG